MKELIEKLELELMDTVHARDTRYRESPEQYTYMTGKIAGLKLAILTAKAILAS